MKPTHIPQKRLYVGKKRICYPYVRYKERILKWAVTVRPGDYIATCEGTNRNVAKVEPIWGNVGHCKSQDGKRNSHWFLDEICFTDTHGRSHYCPAGGCAFPKQTPEEVTQYQIEWARHTLTERFSWFDNDLTAQKKIKKYVERILNYAEKGLAIVDEFGEILPELEGKD